VAAFALFLVALLLLNLRVGVSFCIVAGSGHNHARTHPHCQLDLGKKSEADHCRIILPISTQSPSIPSRSTNSKKKIVRERRSAGGFREDIGWFYAHTWPQYGHKRHQNPSLHLRSLGG
jgi:hypothetical protein